jgi:hypothetical protein
MDGVIIRLADLLEFEDPKVTDFKLLPVCHTTTLEAVRKILLQDRQHRLRPLSFDKTFEEFLLFFFYGRARYMPEEALKDEYNPSNPPIAFVFDIESFLPAVPKRFLPFDSGGFELYKLENEIWEFVLSLSDNEALKKFVLKMFSDNSNYLIKQLTIKSRNYPLCTPLQGLSMLYEFYWKKMTTAYGEQAFTFEIQFADELKINPLAIIMPASLCSDPVGKEQFETAFNINLGIDNKKIYLYNDNNTIVFNYKYLMEEVDKVVNEFLQAKTA